MWYATAGRPRLGSHSLSLRRRILQVKMWDLRKGEVVNTMQGHTDTITGMSVSPDGNFLLSNSMDNTIRVWDVRPFVVGDNRCTKVSSCTSVGPFPP